MSSRIASPWTVHPYRLSLEGRLAATGLALFPVLLAQALMQGQALLLRLAMALAFALPLEALLLAARARPPFAWPGLLNAACIAVLLTLLLPTAMPYWSLLVAIFVAIAIARHAFGGLGHELFNPVMAGYAVIGLVASPWPGLALGEHAWWPAAACALAGSWLLWSGVSCWRAPLAMLAAALLAMLTLGASSSGVRWVDPGQAFVLLVSAFFIVGDPVTGCSTPRGRLAFGAGCGVLAVGFDRSGAGPGGLAFAVLGMNAIAPWLDRQLAPGRGEPRP